MVANPRVPHDPVIDELMQRAARRRSDLTPAQRASLASILSHRCRAYGRPGIDTIVPTTRKKLTPAD
jgi:hypothetical protein